ncbi:GapA-binding peptide SR1P [Paenibacillus swuensis]|uniref:GapA-binding peptide SR1P n=1 Tax=Paenibacillus swuensis TaxID=1178515 RepID=UPI0009EE3416|nr:GapA-binding peptide SR1P [Paenibacillus swuensis]
MRETAKSLHLGVIVCRSCGTMVDTLDTDRVIVYSGVCDHSECRSKEAAALPDYALD